MCFLRAVNFVFVFSMASYSLYGQTARPIEQPADDPMAWTDLTEEQVDEITMRNLKRIMWAVHHYIDAHHGKLPPAMIPNKNLPPEQRLSGFVAILPHLGKRPSYLEEDDPTWKAWKADPKAAMELYKSIDLSRAWDDPSNAMAARTIVTSFVSPSGADMRDREGYAVAHFALVRGGVNKNGKLLNNGPFPLDGKELSVAEIEGTSKTLGAGQIHSELGPWIAAGPSTCRNMVHATAKAKVAGFESQHEDGCYVANCDAYCYFLDLRTVDADRLNAAAGRRDGQNDSLDGHRFANVMDWKAARKKKGN